MNSKILFSLGPVKRLRFISRSASAISTSNSTRPDKTPSSSSYDAIVIGAGTYTNSCHILTIYVITDHRVVVPHNSKRVTSIYL